MKTTGTAVIIATLLAGLAIQCFAVPLSPYWQPSNREEENGDSLLPQQLRNKRAPTTVPNYPLTTYSLRPTWIENGCTGYFNCAPVPPQHCQDLDIHYFYLNTSKLSLCVMITMVLIALSQWFKFCQCVR